MTTRQLAETGGVPASYLAKVLQLMHKGGLPKARCGLHGEFVLSRFPEEISLLDVINAVDLLSRVHRCPMKDTGTKPQLCPLHRQIDQAMTQVERTFATTMLSQLTENLSDGTPFCARVGYL